MCRPFGSQEDHADPAGLEDVLQAKPGCCRPARPAKPFFVFDVDEPGSSPLETLDRSVAPAVPSARTARLEEVDLFVEEGRILALVVSRVRGERSQLLTV